MSGTHKRYGRWTVIGPSSDPRKSLCRCACGTVRAVATKTLSNTTATGKSTSCGCVRRELVAQSNYKHGDATRERRTKEYRAWCHMLGRCDNPGDERYEIYGGRGITVCARWRGAAGYLRFLKDMGRAPSARHSVERKDRDGNYCPSNCCWALPPVQASNTSRNVFFVYKGEKKTVSQHARDLGVNRRYLAKLLGRGVPATEALRRVSRNTRSNYKLKESQ